MIYCVFYNKLSFLSNIVCRFRYKSIGLGASLLENQGMKTLETHFYNESIRPATKSTYSDTKQYLSQYTSLVHA